MVPPNLGFGRFVIFVWTIETYASRTPGVVNVGAEHVPTLAQVQHSAMPLGRPTLGCDSDPLFFGHIRHSTLKSLTD
jgi:hypothetical protein